MLRRLILAGGVLAALAACSGRDDPGPLNGTWRVENAGGMTMKFRPGETEVMGLIEKASYEISGNDAIVTSQSGPMKGLAARYTITGPGTATSMAGPMRKIQ